MLQHDIFNVSHPFRPSRRDDALASPRISPKQLPSSSSVVGLRDWQGKGSARSENLVFPGVDSWPTSPTLAGTTVTPSRVASSGNTPPLVLAPAVTIPHPAVVIHSSPVVSPFTSSPCTPSPLRHPPTQSSYPSPRCQSSRKEDEDDQGDPWYSWLCCVRKKAKSGIHADI